MNKEIGLYVHIPFCKKICSYCDFKKIETKNPTNYENYTKTLIKEIKEINKNYTIKTIFIGGGTPNALPLKYLKEILDSLNSYNPVEYSIELNPDLVNEELVKLLTNYKINRISLGVQTFNEQGLKILKRTHNLKRVLSSYKLLKQHFSNISIDMIYNYPKQTFKNLKKDVKHLLKLKPSHISYYDLIIEENTEINYKIKKNIYQEPLSDNSYKFFNYIIKKLKKHNYNHYEISSFSKNNYQSIHNKIYWQGNEYLGVGLNSTSYINNVEYKNENNFSKYITNYKIKETNKLTKEELLTRTFIMGLRLIDGINIKNIEKTHNIAILSHFKELKGLISDGLLEIKGDILKLTKKGLFLGNLVFEVFV